MALVNGTEYYFIDMQQASGGNTTRHLLKDTNGRAMIAPTEASSTASAAHAAGSYFIYGGTLYRATADIASGATIVTSGSGQNCEAVTVGGELVTLDGEVSDLKSALSNYVENITGAVLLTGWSENHQYIKTNIDTGIDITSPVTIASNVRYLTKECKYGDVFYVTTSGGDGSRAYAFIDSEGNKLAGAYAGTTLDFAKLTAPQNTAYLIVNDTTLKGFVVSGDLEAFVNGELLDNTTDLNTITRNGLYYFISSNGVPPLAPVNAGGLIAVYHNSSFVEQVYYGLNNEYHRFKSSSGWSEWEKRDLSDAFVKGRMLVGTDNLNNITQNGIYYYTTANGIPTNAPVNVGGLLAVFNNGSSVEQVYYGANDEYHRFKGYSGWSSWKNYNVEQQISSVIAEDNAVRKAVEKTFGYIYPRFINGYYNITAVGTTIDITSPVESTSIYTTVIELPDNYYIEEIKGIVGAGDSDGGARAYACLDSSKVVLSRSYAYYTLNDIPTIPAGTKYIILNTTSLTNTVVRLTTQLVEAIKLNYEEESFTISSFEGIKEVSATISSVNKWVVGSSYNSVMLAIPKGYKKKVTVQANSSKDALVSCLTSDHVGANNANVTTFARYETGRHTITANTSASFNVSADCNFLLIVRTSSGNTLLPTSVTVELLADANAKDIEEVKEEIKGIKESMAVTNDFESILSRVIALDTNGHDIPQNVGVYNAYKKAQQMKTIPWKALSTIPNNASATGISAGNQTGFPYSSVKEYNKFVGENVSFKTFMTAAHNPYSLLYTEDVLGSRSTSQYGKTYCGSNCGSYYGIVCSILTGYAVGLGIYWSTSQFDYLYRKGLFGKSYDQSANGIRLMDIIWEPGHANIITDIVRNQHGEPVTIYWTESAGTFPVTHAYTPQQANDRLDERGGIIYYSKELYKNLDYTPSEFVAVGDEPPVTPYDYNDDICTYAGDYACFNDGDDVYINYTAGSYTQMEIYKNDTLIDTISIDPSEHAVKITTTGYGKYKARLKNGSNYSDYTYFEIVDTAVSCSYSNGVLNVTFSSENSTPKYAQLSYRDGTSRGIIELSADDITNGNVQVNPDKILEEQYPGETFASTVYIKVFFKGDYGVVPNAYLDTGIVS